MCAVVVLKKALCLELDVAGRDLENLPILTSKVFSLCTKFSSHVRSVVPYDSETWAVKEEYLAKLERNHTMMVL